MLLERLGASWTDLGVVVLAGLSAYVAVIALTRLHARIAREELWAQLRLAGVHRRDQVRAVVMETTGDVSVLRAGEPLDEELLRGVRGAEHLS